MKEKNESWLLSPHAAYHLELSIDFLHTRPVMDIGANEIPAELLQTWIAPGPKELLIRMADGSAGPNETMPYEVFARAHERHERSYAEMLARLREKRIEVPPFAVFNFVNYPITVPAAREYAWKHGIPSV